MGEVTVQIAGRPYTLNCRDGDEPHVSALGAGLAARAEQLTQQLGPMHEARLLLMTALMVADELEDTRAGKPRPQPAGPEIAPALAERLDTLVARTEALASKLSA